MRARLGEEPYRRAAPAVWHTSTPEGVLARFVGGPSLASFLVTQGLGVVNRDDQNVLEFAFARSVGRRARVDRDLVDVSRRLGADSPQIKGTLDAETVLLERWLFQTFEHLPLHPPPAQTPLAPLGAAIEQIGSGRFATGLRNWQKLERAPRAHYEIELLARAAAKTGDPSFESFAALLTNDPERDLLRALFLAKGDGRSHSQTIEAFERGFTGLRTNPWAPPEVVKDALRAVVQVGRLEESGARRLYDATREPFAAEIARRERLEAQLRLARSVSVPECNHALDRFAAIPWSRSILEIRLLCRRAANHPDQVEAEADLAKLLASEISFHVDLPPPPTNAAVSANAAPPADSDAGPQGPDDEPAPDPASSAGGAR
jgi:hypothetical protein